MLVEGDFALGDRDWNEGAPTYIRLRQTHCSDYLKWFGQVNCLSTGCLKTGVIWDEAGQSHRWRPLHLKRKFPFPSGNQKEEDINDAENQTLMGPKEERSTESQAQEGKPDQKNIGRNHLEIIEWGVNHGGASFPPMPNAS